jgi:hypothetical protein
MLLIIGVLQWMFRLTVRSVTLGGGKSEELDLWSVGYREWEPCCAIPSTLAAVGRFPPLCHSNRSETKAGDNSPTIHSLCPEVEPQVPALRFAPVGMTKGRAVTFIRGRQIGWTERNSKSSAVVPHSSQNRA